MVLFQKIFDELQCRLEALEKHTSWKPGEYTAWGRAFKLWKNEFIRIFTKGKVKKRK
jgi:hypothetical protein